MSNVWTQIDTKCQRITHFVAKIWKHATTPQQDIDSFVENGWLNDGSIDWIDEAYPKNLETLFVNRYDDNDKCNFEDSEDDENLDEDSEDEIFD